MPEANVGARRHGQPRTTPHEILPREIAEAVDPFVKQFEDTLRNGGQPAGSAINGQPSALAAIWEGVTSAAAWTGGGPAGQGGQQVGGQQLGGPAATGFGGPATPAGWNVPAASPPPPGFTPPRPAASGFTAPAAGFAPVGPRYQSAPQPFPVGAQSPLPIR